MQTTLLSQRNAVVGSDALVIDDQMHRSERTVLPQTQQNASSRDTCMLEANHTSGLMQVKTVRQAVTLPSCG